jgi:gamma-glutamylputrescine oxidase
LLVSNFWKLMTTDFHKEKPVYGGVESPAQNSAIPNEIETVVVGGGLLGLSTALELAEAGRKVVVLEARKIADGPSGISGGQLWPGYEGTLEEMKEKFGDNLAKSAWQLTHETLKKVFNRVSTRPDHCDFRPGVLLASKTGPQADWIKKEIKAFQDSGFDFATYVTAEEIQKHHVNTGLYLNGILFKGEEGQQYGHLNPRKYTQTVAQLAQGKGVTIAENTSVDGITALKGGGYLVATSHGDVKTKNVVLAGGVDFMRPKGIDYDVIPRTNVSVQTIIMATEAIPEKLAREMVPGDACFCDASDSAMNYGRLLPEHDRPGYYRLTFGGADGLGQAQVAFDIPKIEKEMRSMFPQLDREGIKVVKIWSGNCDLSRSGLPVIINPCEGIYHASGFSGQGMINTALYGSAIADRILGKNTGKFEILEQLNPENYSRYKILAWLQAALKLLPNAYTEYKEERAERPLRAARAASTIKKQASNPASETPEN